MKAGLFSIASIALLQLVTARAPYHGKHRHLHGRRGGEQRGVEYVQEIVTDNVYVTYDSEDIIVYEDAHGNPVSTKTSWKGHPKTSTSLQTTQSLSTSTDTYTPPPPPPTSTSSSSPPPPPPSSTSSVAPAPAPAVNEKIAQHPQHEGGWPAPSSAPPAWSSAPPAVSSSPPSAGGGGGAKGVAYNTPAQANQISGISWACNWGQESGLSNPPFEYVPQLWGKKDGMCESFASNAAGAKNLLFYNEPDQDAGAGGSAIDVGTAISDFNTIMKPLQAQGKAVSTPCVANSDSGYLETFLEAFPSGSIDIMCFHWYGPDLNSLQSAVETYQGLASKYGIKQLWLNEWAVQPAPNDLSSFTSYLDGKVDRYAYNMNDMGGSTGY